MRTAEEILKSECDKVDEMVFYGYDKGEYGIGAIVNSINQARKEALEAAASVVTDASDAGEIYDMVKELK